MARQPPVHWDNMFNAGVRSQLMTNYYDLFKNELVLKSMNTDEEHWREAEELRNSESTRYIGRAVCALAADPNVMEKSGIPQLVGLLAEEYGFTDIDGRRVTVFEIPE